MHAGATGKAGARRSSFCASTTMTDTTAAPVSPSGPADRTTVLDPASSDSWWKGSGAVPAALGTAALAIPVAAYFWFIDHFSVNVVSFDQWGRHQRSFATGTQAS